MPPRISASEWEIMNVLWARSPLTAPEVMAALPPGTEWAQKTVNTFLARLLEKGAVSATRQGKANLYRPELTREDCVASEGASFLERVFRGAAGDLVLHFCERADLTPDEIRELEALLKSKKGRR
ncbi:MAG TPA: BlaI/MecI/CopY family transcriptional regulator [Opitutaceae bacterium]|nr:BlaI/MecI/CopY family transcriptional regulator [Opitutaceae bacterium]